MTFDPEKRRLTLVEHKVDFLEAAEVFSRATFDFVDRRRDYGETRIVTVGTFRGGRMVIVVWTQRGDARHIISMRKANEREKTAYRHRLEGI